MFYSRELFHGDFEIQKKLCCCKLLHLLAQYIATQVLYWHSYVGTSFVHGTSTAEVAFLAIKGKAGQEPAVIVAMN